MHYFIGFDVGGTHIKHGLIDEHGEEHSSEEFDTPEDEESFKKAWKEVVETYQKDHEIAGIGVSFTVGLSSTANCSAAYTSTPGSLA